MTIDGRRVFRTGDLGRLSPENVLSITGRIKEQYKLANGKFVVPGPIENAIMVTMNKNSETRKFGVMKRANKEKKFLKSRAGRAIISYRI